MAEYEGQARSTREKTARLRALRLAKEPKRETTIPIEYLPPIDSPS